MKLFKVIGFCLVLIHSLIVQGQKKQTTLEPEYEDWYSGTVYFNDGTSRNELLRFIPTGKEGLLQIKRDEQIQSVPPMKISRFSFVKESEVRTFVSIPISDKYRNASKMNEIFLEIHYSGDRYQLYSRYFVKPVLTNHVQWETEIYLGAYDEIYQISNGTSFISSEKFNDIRYIINRPLLKSLLGQDIRLFKTICQEENLKISRISDLQRALEKLEINSVID